MLSANQGPEILGEDALEIDASAEGKQCGR
jgi:hypothetical protein